LDAIRKSGESILFFRNAGNTKDRKLEEANREKWLGIVAIHQLDFEGCKSHFGAGLKVAEQLNAENQVSWFQAAIEEVEAWELAASRFIDLKEVNFCQIAEKFRKAEKGYEKAQ
jgi:hypothetical protein